MAQNTRGRKDRQLYKRGSKTYTENISNSRAKLDSLENYSHHHHHHQPISTVSLLKTGFFILIWYTISTCLTLYNKTLLGDKLGKFPAPLLMSPIVNPRPPPTPPPPLLSQPTKKEMKLRAAGRRSSCCEKVHTNKGAWTKEEDDRLIAYLHAHSEGCWRPLPNAIGVLRCSKSWVIVWIFVPFFAQKCKAVQGRGNSKGGVGSEEGGANAYGVITEPNPGVNDGGADVDLPKEAGGDAGPTEKK